MVKAENNNPPEINSNFLEIETVRFEDNEVSFCPTRGGIITSLKLHGQEILYLDPKNFENIEENVRGGIPILFPQAGPVDPNSQFSKLKQHGFARNSSNWKFEKTDNGFIEKLSFDEETLEKYPYQFEFSIIGKFEDDGSFTLTQEVKNVGDKEMPIAMGLHPYFKVPANEKNNIGFNFPGGEIVKNQTEIWTNSGTTSIDNPEKLEVEIPNTGNLTITPSSEYQKTWVWSLPEKDFICIEPVMRDVNGIIDNPEKIPPQATFSASVNFKLN